MVEKMAPVHPGGILFAQFLKPMEMSQNRLALDVGVAPRRINEIVKGKRRITADTAMRHLPRFGARRPINQNRSDCG